MTEKWEMVLVQRQRTSSRDLLLSCVENQIMQMLFSWFPDCTRTVDILQWPSSSKLITNLIVHNVYFKLTLLILGFVWAA